jgi:hypothetical protein
MGDVCDADIDNDGIVNLQDNNATLPTACQDLDFDQCDDCAIGVDGFGPLADNNVMNDGLDSEGDGMCDLGDPDDDNDMVDDINDNCPLDYNPLPQQDPAACGLDQSCFPVRTATGAVALVCL